MMKQNKRGKVRSFSLSVAPLISFLPSLAIAEDIFYAVQASLRHVRGLLLRLYCKINSQGFDECPILMSEKICQMLRQSTKRSVSIL